MFVTIDEMLAIKEEYRKQALELEMKMAVVDDFVKIAESKQVGEENTEPEESVEETVDEVAETEETNY